MSIIRVIHNRENPYVQLNKRVLFDENLSLKAKGLWAQCLARPDDWKFHITEMVKNCVEGRRAIYSAIQELIDHNYAVKIEHFSKSEKGKFAGGGVEYIFFEFSPTPEEKEKTIEEFKKCFGECGFGNRRGGHLRNSTLLKNDSNQAKKKTNPPTPKGEEFVSFSEFVKLKNTQYKDLCNAHSQTVIDSLIVELNDYLEGNRNKYKPHGHAAVLRQWLRKQEKDPKLISGSSSGVQSFFEAFKEKYGHIKNVTVGYDYIEFDLGGAMPSDHIKISSHGFKEQVLNRLRKMGLSTKDLE